MPISCHLWDCKALLVVSLAPLPGACLHTRLWVPRTSTCAPQRPRCGAQMFIRSRVPAATVTAWSINFNPHDEIGKANNQSPLWRAVARWHGMTRLVSIEARSSSASGQSQNDCLNVVHQNWITISANTDIQTGAFCKAAVLERLLILLIQVFMCDVTDAACYLYVCSCMVCQVWWTRFHGCYHQEGDRCQGYQSQRSRTLGDDAQVTWRFCSGKLSTCQLRWMIDGEVWSGGW